MCRNESVRFNQYSKITKITSVDDMTHIMIVGIQLYMLICHYLQSIYLNVNRIVRNCVSV